MVCVRSAEEAAQHASLLLEHIASLGLRVNVKKEQSVTAPGVRFHWHYTEFSDNDCQASREEDRRYSHPHQLVRFLSILGKLTFVSMVVPLGLLRLRPAQRWLNSQDLHAKHDRLSKVTADHRWAAQGSASRTHGKEETYLYGTYTPTCL